MRTKAIIALLLISVLLLTACASAPQEDSQNPPKTAPLETPQTTTSQNDLSLITEEETDIGEMI
ncbi:MAG TPA: hypothetical protein VK158_03075 [Acidobacteriota bacterium]|nr:hypothetical protein [Acidobacteriota bacterium]